MNVLTFLTNIEEGNIKVLQLLVLNTMKENRVGD